MLDDFAHMINKRLFLLLSQHFGSSVKCGIKGGIIKRGALRVFQNDSKTKTLVLKEYY